MHFATFQQVLAGLLVALLLLQLWGALVLCSKCGVPVRFAFLIWLPGINVAWLHRLSRMPWPRRGDPLPQRGAP